MTVRTEEVLAGSIGMDEWLLDRVKELEAIRHDLHRLESAIKGGKLADIMFELAWTVRDVEDRLRDAKVAYENF